MVKVLVGWANVILLAHLEVLAEVLVSAPPVEMDHVKSLVSANLMEIAIADVVLLSVSRHSTITVGKSMFIVRFSDVPSPVFNHLLFLLLDHNIQQKALVEVESKAAPHEADSVSLVERLEFPVSITCGVLHEPGNVFESTVLLSVVTRLFSVVHKFMEVSVGFLGEGSTQS
jgi:hypothetical protein